MTHASRWLIAASLGSLPLAFTDANTAPVNFSGINSGLVSSPSGQDFAYTIGAGPGGGVLNVRLISGDITTLTTGASPDPTGFYVLQSPALTPVLFRFTFDGPLGIRIDSNETLTAMETNTFVLPPGTGSWSVISATDATVENSGEQVSFVGTLESSPYGYFSISTVTTAFEFLVANHPAYPIYGSAITIDVLDQATPTRRTSWGRLKRLFR